MKMESVPTRMSELSSSRPALAALDNFILRIIDVYEMPSWQESLVEYMEERAE